MNKIQEHLGDQFSYWEHWGHSMRMGSRMGGLFLKSVVHAFFPNIFTDSGPIEIYRTYHEIKDIPNVKKMYLELDQKRG